MFRSNSANRIMYRIEMKLTKPAADILTFSIYARDYQHDILNYHLNETASGSGSKKMRSY